MFVAFGLSCGLASVSPSGPINVDCDSVGGDVEGVVCDYDDGALVEDCKHCCLWQIIL